MKPAYFLVALTLPLFSAGAFAAELDEVTLEVIDAGASSVGDVMRNIEIPDYDRHAGRETGARQHMPAERTNDAGAGSTEHGRRGSEAHGDERRDGAEDSRADHRQHAEETHDEARDAIEEAHDEAGEEQDAAHEDTSDEMHDIESPESGNESESIEAPTTPED